MDTPRALFAAIDSIVHIVSKFLCYDCHVFSERVVAPDAHFYRITTIPALDPPRDCARWDSPSMPP